jgi:hypothetical protein
LGVLAITVKYARDAGDAIRIEKAIAPRGRYTLVCACKLNTQA